MDSKKKIAAYISAGNWKLIVALVLIMVSLVGVCVGAMLNKPDEPTDAQEFYPAESPTGTMAYVDAVGVSDWLYKVDSVVYYVVEDGEGYLYTVRLTDKQVNSMRELQRYWNRTSNSEPEPEAQRIYGTVRTAVTSVQNGISQAFGITNDEYTQYLGNLYLDCGTTPSEQRGEMAFIVALLAFLIAIVFLMIWIAPASSQKKCLKRLEERGEMDRAAEQLTAENTVMVGKDKARLAENYYFGRKTGTVVNYQDILWCYLHTTRYNFIAVNTQLLLFTKDNKQMVAINMGRSVKDGEIEAVVARFAQENPNVLVGYTQENRKAYNERRKLR